MYKCEKLFKDKEGPLLITTQKDSSLAELIESDPSDFKHKLRIHGALLFRGFRVREVGDFDQFVATISDRPMEYLYRSTPRIEVSNRIFTATSYPNTLEIPLHNENAYQRTWPLTLAFCCIEAATLGGETPIAPMRAVTDHIGADLIEKFERCGVKYVRHYHRNMDLSWQTVFQTKSKEAVEKYCANNGIEHTWLDGELLRTAQICHGVARHPLTNEKLFFNQAHLFHVSSLGSSAANALIKLFGNERLPRHANFGDSSEISSTELDRVRTAFKTNEILFRWQSGDVLLLDNMQYAHGRRPYEGSRRVYAALMNSSDLATSPRHP